jgi:hypothetical protein
MEQSLLRAPEMNGSMQTPRLILRLFTQGDLKDLYAYASVEGVGEEAR